MPEIQVAKTIVVVTLPEESRGLIREGVELETIDERRDHLAKALVSELFGTDSAAMERVGSLAGSLSDNQADLLLSTLEHTVDEDHGHSAAVHFLELESEFELEGVGLEIRDDTVTEEKLFGPLRVMFVNWQPRQA